MNRMKRYLIGLVCASLVATQCPMPVFAVEDGSLENATAPETITLNVRDAAIQDVLSALAMNLGYSIVYLGQGGTLSVDLDGLSPEKAFDYVLKLAGLTYLEDGDILIVGTKDVLKSDFAQSLSLTEIPLHYITADILIGQIQTLTLPVTVLSIPHRQDSLWVQGTPQDIAKVRELANLLDVAANRVPAGAAEEKPTVELRTLTPVSTSGSMRPTELNRFLKALGISYGIVADNTSSQLWLYATPTEAEEVKSIIGSIDPRDAESFLSKNSGVKIIWVGNMSKADAQTAIGAACPSLQVITTTNQSKTLCLLGSAEDIQRAEDLLGVMGKAAPALKTSFFVHHFYNISAAEAMRRLELMTFGDDVSFYAIEDTLAEYSGGLFVYCNSDYTAEIKELLSRFDSQSVELQNPFPVFMSSTSAGLSTWQAMFIKVFGLKSSNFMTVQLANDQYVLFMKDINVEQVNLVMQLINQVQSLPGSDYLDLSYDAYVAWCTANKQTPSIDGWQKWVISQLSLTGAGSGSGSGTSPAALEGGTAIPNFSDMAVDKTASDVRTTLQNYFDGYSPTGAETADSVFQMVRTQVETAGYGVKSFKLVSKDTIDVPATTTDTGRLQIRVNMITNADESFDYDVTLVLPLVKASPAVKPTPPVAEPTPPATETVLPPVTESSTPESAEPPAKDLTPPSTEDGDAKPSESSETQLATNSGKKDSSAQG